MKRAEVKQEKLVGEVSRENRRLAQPLSAALEETEQLRGGAARNLCEGVLPATCDWGAGGCSCQQQLFAPCGARQTR